MKTINFINLTPAELGDDFLEAMSAAAPKETPIHDVETSFVTLKGEFKIMYDFIEERIKKNISKIESDDKEIKLLVDSLSVALVSFFDTNFNDDSSEELTCGIVLDKNNIIHENMLSRLQTVPGIVILSIELIPLETFHKAEEFVKKVCNPITLH